MSSNDIVCEDCRALCVDYVTKSDLWYDVQHFSSIDGVAESDVTNYAGAVVLADYCPYVQVSASAFLVAHCCQCGYLYTASSVKLLSVL